MRLCVVGATWPQVNKDPSGEKVEKEAGRVERERERDDEKWQAFLGNQTPETPPPLLRSCVLVAECQDNGRIHLIGVQMYQW